MYHIYIMHYYTQAAVHISLESESVVFESDQKVAANSSKHSIRNFNSSQRRLTAVTVRVQ